MGGEEGKIRAISKLHDTPAAPSVLKRNSHHLGEHEEGRLSSRQWPMHASGRFPEAEAPCINQKNGSISRLR